MFAVPGWSVSGAKLTAEKDKAAKDPKDANPGRNKRKRAAEEAVTTDNYVELWEKVIEGKDGQGPKRQKPAPRETGDDEQEPRPDNDKKTPNVKKDKKRKQHDEDGEGAPSTRERNTKPTPKEEANLTLTTTKTKDGKKDGKKDSKKDKKANKRPAPEDPEDPKPEAEPMPPLPAAPEGGKLTPLQSKMREKLVSARFRHLNETLYTRPSAEALTIFSSTPEMFTEYHDGFRRQVSVWPQNPVDDYIALLRTRSTVRYNKHNRPDTSNPVSEFPLPFTTGCTSIADLGCGDAKIASTLFPVSQKLRLSINSYDLASPNRHVTVADVANLPLQDGEMDIAIFCLALMGTNWLDFIEEAHRILRRGGELWISEIKSRFGAVGTKKDPLSGEAAPGSRVVNHSVGKQRTKKARQEQEERDAIHDNARLAREVDGNEDEDAVAKQETDVSAFVDALKKRGFVPMRCKDAVQMDNKMFIKLFFLKLGDPIRGKHAVGDSFGAAVRAGRPAAAGGTGGRGGSRLQPRLASQDDEQKIQKTERGILKPCVYKIR